MRLFGYALLSIGFIWLLLGACLVRPRARAIVSQHYEQVARQESFTLEQVQRHIREPVFELVDSMPWFALPGALMLAGGICLDRAKRKK